MEIRRTVLKQLVRTEYLIKQKPGGALNRIADRRISLKRYVVATPFFYKLVSGI